MGKLWRSSSRTCQKKPGPNLDVEFLTQQLDQLVDEQPLRFVLVRLEPLDLALNHEGRILRLKVIYGAKGRSIERSTSSAEATREPGGKHVRVDLSTTLALPWGEGLAPVLRLKLQRMSSGSCLGWSAEQTLAKTALHLPFGPRRAGATEREAFFLEKHGDGLVGRMMVHLQLVEVPAATAHLLNQSQPPRSSRRSSRRSRLLNEPRLLKLQLAVSGRPAELGPPGYRHETSPAGEQSMGRLASTTMREMLARAADLFQPALARAAEHERSHEALAEQFPPPRRIAHRDGDEMRSHM